MHWLVCKWPEDGRLIAEGGTECVPCGT